MLSLPNCRLKPNYFLLCVWLSYKERYVANCGPIRSVRLPRWQDSGKPRGYAHVEFETGAAATKAVAMNGEYMLNRYLDISMAKPRAADMHAALVRSFELLVGVAGGKSTNAIKRPRIRPLCL